MTAKDTCAKCGSDRLVRGTLEGVSFVPKVAERKYLSKGIYGITAQTCLECGSLADLGLDANTLRRLIEKRSGQG